MQLPKALTPWATTLSLFPDEIALAMGELMRRVALLIGPFKQNLSSGDITPDGFAGITQKGRYEHLLLSEWLMADEIPEEFLRRAVMNEHQFLQLKTESQQAASFSVVLFDVGPLQLGAPRILHFVLFLLLTQRAALNDTRFYWGILQAPDQGLYQQSNEASMRRLLAATSAHLLTQQHVEQWQQKLQTTLFAEQQTGEVWLVGASSVDLFQTYHTVVISEPPTLGESILTLDVYSQGQRKTSQLALPPQEILLRLLHDPFRESSEAESRYSKEALAHESQFIFSDKGLKIAVKLANGKLAIYSIPNSPRETQIGKINYFEPPEGYHIVALSLQNKRLFVITKGNNRLHFHNFSDVRGDSVVDVAVSQNLHINKASDQFYHLHYAKHSGHHAISLVDKKNSLRTMQWFPHLERFKTANKHVTGIIYIGQHQVYVTVNQQSRVATIHAETLFQRLDKLTVKDIRLKTTAFFYAHKNELSIALPQADHHWLVINHQAKQIEIVVEPNDEVIGVVLGCFMNSHRPCSLITIDANRRCFFLNDEEQTIAIKAKGLIKNAIVNQRHPYIAYQTEDNELCVYSLAHKTHLLHVVAEADHD